MPLCAGDDFESRQHEVGVPHLFYRGIDQLEIAEIGTVPIHLEDRDHQLRSDPGCHCPRRRQPVG